MDDRHWNEPVCVMLGGPEKKLNVTSTREAAECLLDRWPLKQGPAQKTAREACLTVLAGEEPPHVARLAFIEAAREADILVEGTAQGS